MKLLWTDWDSSPEEICLVELANKAMHAREKLKEILPEGADIRTFIVCDHR